MGWPCISWCGIWICDGIIGGRILSTTAKDFRKQLQRSCKNETHPSASLASEPLAFVFSFEFRPFSLSMGAERYGACSRVHMHCKQALLGCCGATKLSSSCYNCYSLVHFSGCLLPGTAG